MDQLANKTIREAALHIALGYNGQEEVPRGSNWGPFVQACLALVGITFAAAWCQAFMYRVYHEAAEALGVACPIFKTGGVLNCWNNTSPNNRITKADARPTNILPGYQFIYDHGKGLGHTGMVVEVFADGSFSTIEGNTDPAGSRNGIGVFKREGKHARNLRDPQLKGFIKY